MMPRNEMPSATTPRLARAVVALVPLLAVAALAWPAPSAYAGPQRVLDTDSVKVESQGIDFGDGALVFGELTESGDVEWKVDDNEVTPVLKGELHLDGFYESQCARLRIDYYTSGTVYLITRHGGKQCASFNNHEVRGIDLSPWTSDKVGKVKITLQRETSSGSWESLGSDWSTLNTYTDHYVDIRSDSPAEIQGFDFGDDTWNGSQTVPNGDGQVEWEFSGGQITPRLTGFLHLDDVPGECARMRVDYYADQGALDGGPADTNLNADHLETIYGGEVCMDADDDSHQRWSVDLGGYSHYLIDHIGISIERLRPNGTWATVDSTHSDFGS